MSGRRSDDYTSVDIVGLTNEQAERVCEFASALPGVLTAFAVPPEFSLTMHMDAATVRGARDAYRARLADQSLSALERAGAESMLEEFEGWLAAYPHP